ncbi:MAG: DNA repair protein RecN [Myxococcota bacterium]
MLAELRIKNFVLIDQLSLTFSAGLNMLSGETGAGKSIILDALNLLLGGKGSPELIRDGADEATVEALFVVADEPWVASLIESLGLEPCDELWIKRTLTRAGRGRVYLNGGPIVLSTLRALGRGLVDFSSQNEHQVLLNPDTHLDILDAYGVDPRLRQRMREAASALRAVLDEQRELLERQRSRTEREDFLRFQVTELERVAPSPGEDQALEEERKLLSHAEKLYANAQAIEQSLYSGRSAAVDALGDALKRLQEIAQIDPSMAGQVQSLEGALFVVEDVARSMSGYTRKIRFNPARLEEINSRLAELASLKRKFRLDLEGIAARLKEMKRELTTLEGAEERLEALTGEVSKRWRVAAKVAAEVSVARLSAARKLEQATEGELRSLSMPRARFVIDVQPRAELSDDVKPDEAPGDAGNDRVEFRFSANAGESIRPLAKVASGGELSRVLLALKRSLAGAGEVGTFIFDEVDTGIGGGVAEVVGRKLKEIAAQRQLLCITHLAQIAAYADTHFIVKKEVIGERTVSQVRPLDPTARVEEIARMLGGLEITERTREHAREMIERCAAYKPA